MTIAVFTKNWIGDVIFQSPAFQALKDNFPGSKLIAVTHPRCVEVLAVSPFVDEIIAFDDRGADKNPLAKLKLIRQLRKRKVDQIYLFHRSWSRAFIARLSGAKVRAGYNTKGRGFLLSRSVPEPKTPVHSVVYFLDLLRAAGLKLERDYEYSFHFSKEDLDEVKKLLSASAVQTQNLVALNPGANWLPKRWPVEYFRELARRLVQDYSVQVVVTGGKSDERLGSNIVGDSKTSGVVSLCGKTNLRELGALFSLCRLVISNDSGPLHIAAGVGANVLGIFGPTDPKLTGPLGKGKNIVIHYAPEGEHIPWYGKEFPYGRWMEHISVDQVLETIRRENFLG